jgi:hypothetical protein
MAPRKPAGVRLIAQELEMARIKGKVSLNKLLETGLVIWIVALVVAAGVNPVLSLLGRHSVAGCAGLAILWIVAVLLAIMARAIARSLLPSSSQKKLDV